MVSTTPLERQLRGDEPAPRTSPIDAFELARRKFLAGERIDMQRLAAELGLHRTTLYRWVGTRDRLIGQVLWSIAEDTAREADERAVTAGAKGGERIARGVERYLKAAHTAPFMRRFLTEEPEAALRIITTKDRILQARSPFPSSSPQPPTTSTAKSSGPSSRRATCRRAACASS